MCKIESAATSDGNISGAPSWDELAREVASSDVGQQLQERDAAIEKGSISHTDVKVRRFGKESGPPRVTLYRDTAAWCPYCQKVWLLLEQKQVDFAVEKVNMRSYGDKTQAFLNKVPRGLLPAIEINGRFMTESLDIMFAIENAFPDPDAPMMPPLGPQRERAISLLQLERAVFGAWCQFLFTPELPIVGTQTRDFRAALRRVDEELAANTQSKWFLYYGHPTIVDMQYVSHMERMVASALYYKGFDVREQFPNIDEWLAAFELLPHYMATKSDYYTHCMDIPPQYGTPLADTNTVTTAAQTCINPDRMRVPVSKDDMELWSEAQLDEDEDLHRCEAVWKLIKNHEAVARFSCRAAGSDVGKWAFANPTRSQLADPYAKPNTELIEAVDVLLRVVATAMVRNRPEVAKAAFEMANETLTESRSTWRAAGKCLQYLRDRVGVPRDMQMPAAKNLRAHLSEVINAIPLT